MQCANKLGEWVSKTHPEGVESQLSSSKKIPPSFANSCLACANKKGKMPALQNDRF
jgi:hypothetical protein